MDNFKELGELIYKYRVKIADFYKSAEFFVYTDYDSLNKSLDEILNAIKNLVNDELSYKFLMFYGSSEEMVLDIEPVFEKILFEVDRLKGIYKELDKHSYDDKLKIYQKMIKKIISQIEMFFIELENTVLKGAKGELNLKIDINDEVEELKKSFSKEKNSFGLSGFLAGLGLGWFLFGE